MPPSRPSQLGPGKKLLFACILGAVAALALDTLFRVWLAARSEPASAAAIRNEAARIVTALTESIPMPGKREDHTVAARGSEPDIIHPFQGYDHAAGIRIINDARAYCATPARKDEFAIAILGGSVAGIFGNYGAKTLKETLWRDERLRGKRINILSMGRGGYRQPQQLMALAFMLSIDITPDAVINIDGFNEMAIGTENAQRGVFPPYPSFAHWASVVARTNLSSAMLDRIVQIRMIQERTRDEGEALIASPRCWSAVLGYLALRHLRQARAEFGTAQADYVAAIGEQAEPSELEALHGPTFPRQPEAVAHLILEEWVESSVSMDAMCRARGIQYLHVLQPTLHDPGSKPLTEDEIRNGGAVPAWTAAIRGGYPLLREAGAELGQRGVPFCDASRAFETVAETLYYDNCHFDSRGNEILAEIVGKALLAALPERR